MKYLFFIVFILTLQVNGQTLYTFANTSSVSIAAGATSSINVTVSGVPTSGMVLRQVNIGFGNSGTTNSGNVNAITMRVKDVVGNISTMLSPTSFDGATGDYRLFDIHLRDDNVLKTPKDQKNATSSVLSKGYPFHYGYYKPEGNFSGFNTTSSVNGTWQFVVNNGAAGARIFTKIELVFGPAIVVTDIRTTKPNKSCATKQCIDGTSVYYATNNGYPTGQTVTPPNTVGSCAWNGQKDNNNWFFFQATGSTAYVSVSGFSSVQESSVFTVSTCSASATYNIVSGGCGPSDMFVAGHNSQKYNSSNGTYAGGYAWNHGYYLTGLTIGSNYVFIIDGSSAAVSEFYVEVTGNAANCSIVLPLNLLTFEGRSDGFSNIISWATDSDTDTDYFELEKSEDGINFKPIARIKGKNNPLLHQRRNDYEVTDELAEAYYRLKQVDLNGSQRYFNTIFLEQKGDKNQPMLVPNPASDIITIKLPSATSGYINASIRDFAGQELHTQQLISDGSSTAFSLNIDHLAPGLYTVLITIKGKTHHYKMIKK